MNIDNRLINRVYERLDGIDCAKTFTNDERSVLKAAVLTMAEGFNNVTFAEIPDTRGRYSSPGLFEFFLSGVRWHWAKAVFAPKAESWATSHDAARCPMSDIAIDLLIRRYELTVGPIWTPDAAAKPEGSAAR